MKLTKKQIDVVIDTIWKELKEESDAAIAEFKENNEVTIPIGVEKDIRTFVELREKLKDVYGLDSYCVSYYTKYESFIDKLKSTAMQEALKDIPTYTYEQVESKVILATIDTNNLEELITKVKQQLIK